MKRVTFVSSFVVLAAMVVVGQGCGTSGASTFLDGYDETSSGSAVGSFGLNPTDGGSQGVVVRDGGDGVDGVDGNAECATASAEAKRVPVYMQLVVDGSGSMDGLNTMASAYVPGERELDPLAPNRPSTPTPGMTGRKWIALRGALSAFVDDLAVNPDPSFAVGMYLFSSNQSKAASQVDVPIAFVDAAHAATLKARLLPPVFPIGGTPLATAMNGQLPILKAYTPAPPVQPNGKLVLVVITDGIPTDSKQGCLNAASTALAGTPPVLTFAVGVGDETASATDVYDEIFMGDLAEAGGTAPAGCNTSWSDANMSGAPCHFQITPGAKTAQQIQADFLAAVNGIRAIVSSCELELNFAPGEVDPAKVNVVYTSGAGQSSQVVQDGTDGWTYDDPGDPKKVILHGAACDTLKSDPQGKVDIVLGCKTVTNPGGGPGSGPK